MKSTVLEQKSKINRDFIGKTPWYIGCHNSSKELGIDDSDLKFCLIQQHFDAGNMPQLSLGFKILVPLLLECGLCFEKILLKIWHPP